MTDDEQRLSADIPSIKSFFSTLHAIKSQHQIHPGLMINFDETCLKDEIPPVTPVLHCVECVKILSATQKNV